jgi:hypothetical protein
LLDSAVAGTTTLSADTTLTTTTGASNQARQAILLCTGQVANITITAPAQSKIYTVINASATYTVKIRGAGPTTGITIPVSSTATVAWNGSDFVDATNYINGNIILGSGTANGVAYLNATKQITTGSALTFNGTTFTAGTATSQNGVFKTVIGSGGANEGVVIVSGTTGTGWLGFNNGNNANIPGQVTYDHSTGALSLYANGGPVIFSASAAEGMRLTSTGLGIGQTSPTAPLHITTSGTANNIQMTGSGTAGTYVQMTNTGGIFTAGVDNSAGGVFGGIAYSGNVYMSGAYPMLFWTNGQLRVALDASGRLGVGNTTPANYQASANQLVVGLTGNNGITVVSGTTGTGNLFFSDGTSGTEGYRGVVQYDHSLDSMNLGTSALTRLTIDSSGRLGIGNTSPTAGITLDKYGTAWNTSANTYPFPAGNVFLAMGAPAATDNWFGFIGGYGNSSGSANILLQANLFNTSFQAGNFIGTLCTSDRTADLQFGTMTGGASTTGNATKNEQMRLTSPGALLLGTTTLGYGSNLKFMALAANGDGTGTYTSIGYGASGGSVYTDLGETRVTGGYSTNNGYLVGFRTKFSIGSSTSAHGIYNIYGYTASAGADVVETGSYFRLEAGGVVTFPQYGAGTLSTNASGVISASDGRFKNKTRPVENGLDAVMQLQPTYYRWKDDCQFHTEHEEIGFIAQEVAAIIPAASPDPQVDPILDDVGNMLTVKYKNYHDRAIMAVMVKAIQEQQALITQLTARITALEGA